MRASSEEGVWREATVALPGHVDLHARPAADLVRAATAFAATVRVVVADREADAKSLLAILALGARRGTQLRLRAQGPDAQAALDALAGCIGAFNE
jgi:phosphotransferase system HPr (HPr) family protein